jgi:hypothetical protein
MINDECFLEQTDYTSTHFQPKEAKQSNKTESKCESTAALLAKKVELHQLATTILD